ncbi:MAG: outer membrane lipoprotein-sorting protein [Fimbriimonas sp.]
MTNLLALAALSFAAPQSTNINDYVSRQFEDATLTASVVKGDQRELQKINGDFGQSYRFESTKIMIKEPFKLRLETSSEDTDILYILNGTTQVMKIPKARINLKQNLGDKPGRRQTSLDFGFLTPSLFAGTFFTAKFVREDRASGDAVFDITYIKSLDDTSRHRVWLDPEKKVITKREWYNQHGRQLATFFYENAKLFDGTYMPTQLRVVNVEGKVAGITKYDSIRVNTGLSDSLFSL